MIQFLFISLLSLSLSDTRADRQKKLFDQLSKIKTTWKPNLTDINASPMLGSIIDHSHKLPIRKPNLNITIPVDYDLRLVYSKCSSISEIRDQANCGSCWAFGAAEVMSDRICIKSKGLLQTRISPAHWTTCCALCGYGCNGGYSPAAFTYWSTFGIPTGGMYQDLSTCKPYFLPPCDHHVDGKYGPCQEIVETPECVHECQEGYEIPLEKDLKYADSAYSLDNNEEDIMKDIYQNGSVEASFSVYEDFPWYQSGIYQYVQGSYIGGHAIKILGWGVDNGIKYWWCANSWNEGWGEKGFFRILRGVNECGIEENVVAGIPKIDDLDIFFWK